MPHAPSASCLLQVFVSQSDSVDEGQALAVVEAMKQHHTVCSPVRGTIAELHAFVDAQVEDSQLLMVVMPQQEGA